MKVLASGETSLSSFIPPAAETGCFTATNIRRKKRSELKNEEEPLKGLEEHVELRYARLHCADCKDAWAACSVVSNTARGVERSPHSTRFQ